MSVNACVVAWNLSLMYQNTAVLKPCTTNTTFLVRPDESEFLLSFNRPANLQPADFSHQGSVLYHWYTNGKLERSEGSSITEGIGQGRVTANMEGAPIDQAICVLDTEAVEMVSSGDGWNIFSRCSFAY